MRLRRCRCAGSRFLCRVQTLAAMGALALVYLHVLSTRHTASQPEMGDADVHSNRFVRGQFSEEEGGSNVSIAWMQEAVVNPHGYRYLLNPESKCLGGKKEKVDLVLAVPSSVPNVASRQAVRETWGQFAYSTDMKVVLVFFLGKFNTSRELDDSIHLESQKFDDIVQEDFVDSYRNLTLKSVSILKWLVSFCPHASFAIKVDDDMFLNVPKLLSVLRQQARKGPPSFITGFLHPKVEPHRNRSSKWFISPSEYSGKLYPPFVSGTAYAFSGPVFSSLYEASLRTLPFVLEDVYVTGLCAEKAGVARIGQPLMKIGSHEVFCGFRDMVANGHPFTSRQIRQLHARLKEIQLKCDMFYTFYF